MEKSTEELIDDLYEEYLKGNEYGYTSYFNYKYHKAGNKEKYIEDIKEYIKSKTTDLAKMYKTNKYLLKEDEKIANIVSVFETVAKAVDDYIDELRDKYHYIDQDIDDGYFNDSEYDYEVYKGITPHDLLTMNTDVIIEGFKNYPHDYHEDVTPEMFDKVMEIIDYIKRKDTIKKSYKHIDWKKLPFKEVLFTLYDSNKKNEIFDIDITAGIEYNQFIERDIHTFFNRIIANCDTYSTKKFDKYRTALISSKNSIPNLNKVVFAKNLLEYYKTKIMPTPKGYIDCTLYSDEEEKAIDDLSKVYCSKFTEKKFQQIQSNFIFTPINMHYKGLDKVEKVKHCNVADGTAIGVLISGRDNIYESDVKTYYLIHMFLKDIGNDKCTYELQFNVIPNGNIKSRIQLLRLDNWSKQGAHKNLGEVLSTTTHIHVYNHFDLLRGKENGAFEIAYNIENQSTDFLTSLDNFLNILEVTPTAKKEIISSFKKIKAYELKKIAAKNEI